LVCWSLIYPQYSSQGSNVAKKGTMAIYRASCASFSSSSQTASKLSKSCTDPPFKINLRVYTAVSMSSSYGLVSAYDNAVVEAKGSPNSSSTLCISF